MARINRKLCMDYLDEFTVVFGSASSVTRETVSTVTGHIDEVKPISGTGHWISGGGGGGGSVWTEHESVERAIIEAENGREYAVRYAIDEPLMKDGSTCALLLQANRPVELMNVRREKVVEVNDGPDTPPRAAIPRLYSIAVPLVTMLIGLVMYSDARDGLQAFGGLAMMLVGLCLGVALFFAMRKETLDRAARARRAVLRHDMLKREVDSYLARRPAPASV